MVSEPSVILSGFVFPRQYAFTHAQFPEPRPKVVKPFLRLRRPYLD